VRAARDVTPGAEVKLATVASLQAVAVMPVTAVEMAAQIRADMDAYERMSRNAALIALRVGLRLIWLRDNEPHGTLLNFMAEHFADKSQRTLYNYIRISDQFLTDAGLRDKATFKLTGKALAAVAPICEVQLELFSDPEARLEGALKKLVKWVGERGLADIYKELESRKVQSSPPKGGKRGGEIGGGITVEQRMEVAREQLGALQLMLEGGAFEFLDDEDLATLDRVADELHQRTGKLLRERRAAEAAKPQPRRRGK